MQLEQSENVLMVFVCLWNAFCSLSAAKKLTDRFVVLVTSEAMVWKMR